MFGARDLKPSRGDGSWSNLKPHVIRCDQVAGNWSQHLTVIKTTIIAWLPGYLVTPGHGSHLVTADNWSQLITGHKRSLVTAGLWSHVVTGHLWSLAITGHWSQLEITTGHKFYPVTCSQVITGLG